MTTPCRTELSIVEAVKSQKNWLVLYGSSGDYYVLSIRDFQGTEAGDKICGAMRVPGVKGWFNLTRRTLLWGPLIAIGRSALEAAEAADLSLRASKSMPRRSESRSSKARDLATSDTAHP